MMQRITTLGLDERLERVLAYAFLWVSGLIFFIFEKNSNVRWHAAQSLITFGSLGLLTFIVSLLKRLLEPIWLIGWLSSFGLGLLIDILGWVTLLLWIWLLIQAWIRPDYRLPYVSNWVRYLL
ncbi:DUF4870 domain-containing protein [Tengunoibacter tsumagoiensis]|uniref:DUF4870 domain-containing protein n=1 Tax=Tengunoibacter tsumagoiensis TaxID=2014871 RepID=A0A402A5J7_9CHLR|nr:hypothetical protein [Tengunoibacter tsumagoiensis]GCE14326.1 hypothetical protein KTT_41850 [Tengunoibacter tsumagoiensis]